MSEKVVLVVIDGLGFETAIANCGFLESLVSASKARRWRMRTALPTLSVPLYETLHCGLEPHEHGITSNDHACSSTSEHVFAVATRHGRRTAAVASYSFSELYNGVPYDPIADQEVDDENRMIQHGRFFTTHGKAKFNLCLWSEADLMTQASIMIERRAPDYVLVHSESCDAVGHKYGCESPEYQTQAWLVDNQLAQHAPRWRARGYRVLVTADHGMNSFGHHGGTTDDVRDVPFYDLGHEIGGESGVIVSQLAVAPTILGLMRLPIPAAMLEPPLVVSDTRVAV